MFKLKSIHQIINKTMLNNKSNRKDRNNKHQHNLIKLNQN